MAAALVGGCRHYRAAAPDGFAGFEKTDDYQAVSPDGVVYRVREEPNEPKADLAFWKEKLRNHMADAGYHVRSESDIKAGTGEPGYLLELTAPVGAVDYLYLVGVFLKGDRIFIAEAAGDVLKLEARRAAIQNALDRMELK